MFFEWGRMGSDSVRGSVSDTIASHADHWLCQISLMCVSTPADIFLVFRTLLNCLKCIN